MKTRNTILLLSLLLCAFLLIPGCTDTGAASGNSSSSGHLPAGHLPDPSGIPPPAYVPHPHTVSVSTAYNETLATFWGFTIGGPYDTDPNWTSAYLDPEPVILADVNGSPMYYEFYLRNGDSVTGCFWTAANRILGHNVFRIYPSPPPYNHSAIAREAESVVRARYPDYPVLSNTPALYGGNSYLCSVVMIRNRSSGTTETIVVDAFTHEIVPDHPSEGYKGHGYARSYLDTIPEDTWPALVAQWELQDANATPVVNYILAQGIDPRLPLSEKNVSIIRAFYGLPPKESPPNIPGPGEHSLTEAITDDDIALTRVPVETARTSAQVCLWRTQLDRPELSSWPSWRNASLNMTSYTVIEDIAGRPVQYLFPVEREGHGAGSIVVGANRALGANIGGAGRSDYDIPNASRAAREVLDRDYPGYRILYDRPVSAIGAHPGLWDFVLAEGSRNPRLVRVAVNTQSFEVLVENESLSKDPERFLSAFSRITRQDALDAGDLWEKEDAKDREFFAFAQSQGISGGRPLTDKEIIALGTYLFKSDLQHRRQGELYNPLSEPAIRPTLDAQTRAWHAQSDWYSSMLVDASLDKKEIEQIVRDHSLPGNYNLDVQSADSAGRDYYLDVP
ncbi:hypothetical protein [Methanoregula sp.]|uniref:hypothetical protein n=1 Tax=Methanoregula sp. TaxID=2052170 RepID=UPI003565C830